MHYSEACGTRHASTTKSRDSALALSLHDYRRGKRLIMNNRCAFSVYAATNLRVIGTHDRPRHTQRSERDSVSLSFTVTRQTSLFSAQSSRSAAQLLWVRQIGRHAQRSPSGRQRVRFQRLTRRLSCTIPGECGRLAAASRDQGGGPKTFYIF
ncbi:MAG: hypothetical protein ABR985_06210 [Methanotrichaceae archaeon]|jgi:hypothetical protein